MMKYKYEELEMEINRTNVYYTKTRFKLKSTKEELAKLKQDFSSLKEVNIVLE